MTVTANINARHRVLTTLVLEMVTHHSFAVLYILQVAKMHATLAEHHAELSRVASPIVKVSACLTELRVGRLRVNERLLEA